MLGGSSCPSCSAVNPRINRFCNQCGHVLQRESNAQDVAAPSGGYGCSPEIDESVPPRRNAIAFPSLRQFFAPALSCLNAATAASATVAARRSTSLLISGGMTVALAQLGLLFSIELNEKAPLGYLLMLALGVGLFAIGSGGLWIKRAANDLNPAVTASSPVPPPDFFSTFSGTISVLTGAVLMGILIALLGAGSTWGWTLLPWVLSLVAFAVPIMPRSGFTMVGFRSWMRERYPDLIVVLALVGLFIGLNIHDLQDWYYSAIGDEFIFFEHARHITEEGIARPFSQEGVYNKHPVMHSVLQAAVMRVFGADYFGWTFSEVLNAAIAIPGIYVLGHVFGGRKAAVVSAALFSFSHFMFGFSHVGYNNLSAIPVAVWSLALFVVGWRRGNPLLLYAAGLIAGLGFFTHYSGRAIVPVMFFFAVTAGSPRQLLSLWPLALGFVLVVTPAFVVDQEQVITRMFGQIVGGYSEVVTGPAGQRILNNIETNLPAFNYNSTVHTYVYGPLLDPISAVLATLGIAFAVGNIRSSYLRFLLIWFGIAALMAGILSPYPHVAITRMAFVVPPLVLLAGTLVAQMGDAIQPTLNRYGPLLSETLVPGLLLSVMALVLALNLWQFWHVTPSVFPHRPEAVAMGAFRSEPCDSDASGTVFVGQSVGDGSLLKQALSAFHPDGPLPQRMNYDELVPGMNLPDGGARCVVFVNPGAPEALELQEDLARRYPEGQLLSFANPSGTTMVEIFALPQY